MRKKFLTMALAAVMVVGSTVNTMAATTISGAWWTAWTEGYEVKDSVEFDIDVKGGTSNWNNVSAVFANGQTTGTDAPAGEVEGYKEYAVIRADSWGWGGGDNMSVDGNAITYETTLVDANADGEIWDEFLAIMADAHIDATITKTATGIELVYNVAGANGGSFTYTAKTDVDTSAGLYVFFVCDNSEVTVAKVDASVSTDNSQGASVETAETETTSPADNETASAGKEETETATTAGEVSTDRLDTDDAVSPKTGDNTSLLPIAVLAVAGMAVVVLRRKGVTE